MPGRIAALTFAIAAALLAPRPASASDLALVATLEGTGISAKGDGGELDVDEEVRPGPLAKRHFTLEGSGSLVGADARYVFLVPAIGLRIGLGGGFFGASGITAEHDALPDGFRVTTTSTLALAFEASLGREFDAGPVIPYLDARFDIEDFVAQIQLRSDTYGFLGKSAYSSTSFGFGPRVGMLVPLGDKVYIDVSGTYHLAGPWRLGASAGLAVMLGEREPRESAAQAARSRLPRSRAPSSEN